MMIQITKIKNNPNNPRTISNDALDKLMRSISQFPEMMEKRPMICVTDTDSKIYPLGGNMRLKAIKKLGMKEIPATWVMMADDWTEEQRRQFIIKDNASLGEWSTEELLDGWSLDELEEWGVDTMQWGSDVDEDDINDSFEFTDEDKEPFQQMTFTLADEQAELIKSMIKEIQKSEEYKYVETFGNMNSNGNALYLCVSQNSNRDE